MKKCSAVLAAFAMILALTVPAFAEEYGQLLSYSLNEELPLEKYLTEQNLGQYQLKSIPYTWGQDWRTSADSPVIEDPQRFQPGVQCPEPMATETLVLKHPGSGALVGQEFPSWVVLESGDGKIQNPAMNITAKFDEEKLSSAYSSAMGQYDGFHGIYTNIVSKDYIDQLAYSIESQTGKPQKGMRPGFYFGWEGENIDFEKIDIAGHPGYRVKLHSREEWVSQFHYILIADHVFSDQYLMITLYLMGDPADSTARESMEQSVADKLLTTAAQSCYYEAALYEAEGNLLEAGAPLSDSPAGGFLSPEEQPKEPPVAPEKDQPEKPSSPKNDEGEDFGDRAADGVKKAIVPILAAVGGTVLLGGKKGGLGGLFDGNPNIRTDEDGAIWVKDPTGQTNIYVPKGDGTYRNPITDTEYTPEEIRDQSDRRWRNSGTIRQDYDFTQRATNEQRAANQNRNQDVQDFYDRQKKDREDWNRQQERKFRQQRTATHMGLPYDSDAETIRKGFEKKKADEVRRQDVYKYAEDVANVGAVGGTILKSGADLSMDAVSSLAGTAGKGFKSAYTVATSSAESFGKAVSERKDFVDAVKEAGKGALKGGIDAGLGLMENNNLSNFELRVGASGAGNVLKGVIDGQYDIKDFEKMSPKEQEKALKDRNNKIWKSFTGGVAQGIRDGVVDVGTDLGKTIKGDEVLGEFISDKVKKGVSKLPVSDETIKNVGEWGGKAFTDGVKNSDMVSSAGETVGKKVASTVLTPNLEETAQAAKTTGLKPGNGSRK